MYLYKTYKIVPKYYKNFKILNCLLKDYKKQYVSHSKMKNISKNLYNSLDHKPH